jgi:hypothetical protein
VLAFEKEQVMNPGQLMTGILAIGLCWILYLQRCSGSSTEKEVAARSAESTNLIVSPSVTIDAARTSQPISKYIYGQFIEHLGRCIYGGIWAEMLEDRKFYYPITTDYAPWETITPPNNRWSGAGVPYKILGASPWQIVGPTENLSMVKKNAYVGEHTPHIKLKGTPGGIVQKDLGLVKNKKIHRQSSHSG